MALKPNQPKRGAQHRSSPNPTKRAGRSDGLGAQKVRGVTKIAGAETKPDKGVRPTPGDNRSYGAVRTTSVPVKREDDGVANA